MREGGPICCEARPSDVYQLGVEVGGASGVHNKIIKLSRHDSDKVEMRGVRFAVLSSRVLSSSLLLSSLEVSVTKVYEP